MPEFDFTTLSEFFAQQGFGGATSAEDIVRLLGQQAGVEIGAPDITRFAASSGLPGLLKTTRTGLGELPGLLSTLTGQAQSTADIGLEAARGAQTLGGEVAQQQFTSGTEAAQTRFGFGTEAAGEKFLTGRRGLLGAALDLGETGRATRARTGFAGGGAGQRQQQRGRRQLEQQLSEITGIKGRETGRLGTEREQSLQGLSEVLGLRTQGLEQQFETSEASIEDTLSKALFGAGETVGEEQGGLLAALLGGITNLRETLRSEGVFDDPDDSFDLTNENAYLAWLRENDLVDTPANRRNWQFLSSQDDDEELPVSPAAGEPGPIPIGSTPEERRLKAKGGGLIP